jgi:hypothetical protein
MDPDEHEFDPHRGPIGPGVLIGAVVGVMAWWGVYKLVVILIHSLRAMGGSWRVFPAGRAHVASIFGSCGPICPKSLDALGLFASDTCEGITRLCLSV